MRIAQRRDLLAASCDDDVVILAPETGAYYHLNSTAAWIWRRVEQPAHVTTLVQELCREFDVDAAEGEGAVTQLVRSEAGRHLFQIE